MSKQYLLALLALTGSADAAPAAVPTEEAAIAIGQNQCDFAKHDYQKWTAISAGEDWEVRGEKPRRFTAMGTGIVSVPKNGGSSFNCRQLSAPNVPADSFGSRP